MHVEVIFLGLALVIFLTPGVDYQKVRLSAATQHTRVERRGGIIAWVSWVKPIIRSTKGKVEYSLGQV